MSVDIKTFRETPLGLFIHWGIYALTEWQEQALWRGNMNRAKYEELVSQFNPVAFDPDQWLDYAEAAGMTYLCFTSKHHDGFCMWDTKNTDYNVMNTPCGKDIIGLLSEACAKRGFEFGLYYSLPDWHHPTYPNMGRHHEMFGPRPGDTPDPERYLDYVELQLKELLSNYGKITQLFWDIPVKGLFRPRLNELVRELQPDILISDRGPGPGDFITPERKVPAGTVFDEPAIAIQSMGRESWGYRKDEDFYSHQHLMRSIDKVLAMGGRFQLNVGPRPDGTFTDADIAGLTRIGKWYKKVRESFVGCVPCSYMLEPTNNVGPDGEIFNYADELLATRRANTIYVHAYKSLETCGIILHPICKLPEKATLLNNGQPVKAIVDVTPWRYKSRPALRLANLPVNEIPDEPLVVKLEFGEELIEGWQVYPA